MNIRSIHQSDLCTLKRIHEEFYKEDFDFPNFLTNFLCAFTVTDNSDSLILAGGIRTIVEIIAITDQDRKPRDRADALYKLLDACEFVTRASNHNQIHAFIQDPKWSRRLKKNHFEPIMGEGLVLKLE